MKKLRKMLSFLALLLVLSACQGVRVKEKGNSWARIEQNKRVIVGLDDTFVPMGFQEKDGKLTGFDVDLARAVFDLYDIKVDFQAIDWNMKENELNNQTIDLIWNGYTVNDERVKKVAFSKPYMKNMQVLVTMKSADITSFSAMKGKILGAQNGSSGLDVLNGQPKILKQYIQGEPVLYEGFNEALMDLRVGRIQGLLIDRVYADYYLSKDGDKEKYRILSGDFETEDFAVGARKQDRQLVNKINEALKELVQNGTFEKISIKWFGEDVATEEIR